MEAEYKYHNFIWKDIYSSINTNKIFPVFNKGEHFSQGFNSVVSECVSLANYSIKNSDTKLFLSIKNNENYFEFNSDWFATKMKGTFLMIIYDEIFIQGKTKNEYINWRGTLFDYLDNLKEKVKDFEISINEQYKIELKFKVELASLQQNFEPLYFLDNKFIIELSEKNVEDVFKIGLQYLNTDDKTCIGIQKTIVDQMPYAGLIIGVAYFNLRKSELSNQYITNALKKINEYIDLGNELEAIIAEIIATNELNLGVADDTTIRTFFNVLNKNQSQTALIKISYLILSKNIKHLKEFALENVTIATDFCSNDEHEFSKASGFHIICSVLLWNSKFKDAEKYHHFFLIEDNNFYIFHQQLIESYILLGLAKNNINFISNLFLDFPHLKKSFISLLDAWNFDNIEDENKIWDNLNLYNFQKI